MGVAAVCTATHQVWGLPEPPAAPGSRATTPGPQEPGPGSAHRVPGVYRAQRVTNRTTLATADGFGLLSRPPVAPGTQTRASRRTEGDGATENGRNAKNKRHPDGCAPGGRLCLPHANAHAGFYRDSEEFAGPDCTFRLTLAA